MTVGIAIILRSGVLAVADGRTSVVGTHEITSDTTQKIQVLGPSSQVTIFGVSVVTTEAFRLFRSLSLAASAKGASAQAAECLAIAWERFRSANPQVDLSQSALRAALILTGVDAGRPYLSAVMVDAQGLISVGPTSELGANIVLGAESFDASSIFLRDLNASVSESTLLEEPGIEALRVAGAAGAAISRISKLDPSVGGRVHYRALFVDREPLHGAIL